MKMLSLFSGIGAFEKALSNLKIRYELINFIEIDRFASKSYCLIHNEDENKNLWDITKVNEKELLDFDLMTYGFPCQSFSFAGKRLGLKDPVKGNLFFESMRIAKEKKPKYMIAENVKGLLSDDNGQTMNLIITTLDKLGYNNYYKVLNVKDYGIPQNRERIFIVSIRKDIDNLSFEFPEKQKLKFYLQDIIENFKYLRDENYKNGREKLNDIRIYKNYSPSLTTSCNISVNELRKISCLECMKLTGFTENDYNKIKSKISDNQIYKQCGNSIVVNVLETIFKNLFLSDNKKKWLF